MDLKGKIALVTGGAAGIGRATARRFAAEGARVAIVDVDDGAGSEVARDLDGWFGRADVGDLDQMLAVVDSVVEDLGGLDIAYLNAGVTTGERDIWSLSPQAYRRAVGVNVDGVVFGARAAVPAMAKGGALIATASLAGLVAYPGDPIYALTKHAVVGFVRSTAEQLKQRSITINAVCPGFTETAMLEGFVDAFKTADFPLLQPDEVAAAVVTAITSGQTGQVFVCQPGRTCEPYKFRGVPGPRAEGAEGMAPPVRPSAQ